MTASIGLGVLTLALTGCHKSPETSEEKSVGLEVSTTNPERKDLTRVVIQPGYLRPYEMTPIYTKIGGFAEEPKHDIGDQVKKGELLLKIYLPEVEKDLIVKEAKVKQAMADVKQAKAACDAAGAAVNAARADIDAKRSAIKSAVATVTRWNAETMRAKKLVEGGTFDLQTLDEITKEFLRSEAKRDEATANMVSAQANFIKAEANYAKSEADIDVAKASVEVAEAARDQWKDWLAYRNITAPYDGVITNRIVHTGHFLQPANSGTTSKTAEPLFVMMRTDIMRCTVEVPELDALLIRRGDKAVIQFQAMPGAEFEGTVKRTTKALDERTHTLRIEVWLDNPSGVFLRPNMYANVSIKPKLPNSWSLPEDCVMNDILANGNRSYCFEVVDGKARKLFVEKGVECDGRLWQLFRKQRAGQSTWEEFTGKEVIITSNTKALQDGQEVRIKAPATK